METKPNGQPLRNVLKSESNHFDNWSKMLFDAPLPFEDLAALGPKEFDHSEGRKIYLDYFPIYDENEIITGVVTVASDRTAQFEAQIEADKEKAHVKLIKNLVFNSYFVGQFVNETESGLSFLKSLQSKDEYDKMSDSLLRVLHTIKGGAGTLGAYQLTQTSHSMEELFLSMQENLFENELVEQFKQKIDLLERDFSEVSDLIIDFREASMKNTSSKESTFNQILNIIPNFNTLSELSVWIRNQIESTSIKDILSVYNGTIEEAMNETGKKVHPLQFKGEDISVSKESLSSLFQSFVHLFRNAVDHGIESPETRIENGKEEMGQIIIFTSETEDSLVIEVRDDGGGINPEIIKGKLDEKGINAENLTDEEIIQYIFKPQFSTKDEVTQLSGRGVGMESVLFEAQQLGGHVFVKSNLGRGTTVTITIPKTKLAQVA